MVLKFGGVDISGIKDLDQRIEKAVTYASDGVDEGLRYIIEEMRSKFDGHVEDVDD